MHFHPTLRRAYVLMRREFGHQNWWPGDSPFEVVVGAILTQNTSWSNVERAIDNLKAVDVLTPRKLLALPIDELAELLRPAGYFNLKAKRLRSFLTVLRDEFAGDLDQLLAGDTASVRNRLLAINGIGRETADSILLYAGEHCSFVVDAYTRRVFERHHWWADSRRRKSSCSKTQDAWTYESLKQLCESSLDDVALPDRLDYWRDYHAQLVVVGKRFCRPREPKCEECPLRSLLPSRCGSSFTSRESPHLMA